MGQGKGDCGVGRQEMKHMAGPGQADNKKPQCLNILQAHRDGSPRRHEGQTTAEHKKASLQNLPIGCEVCFFSFIIARSQNPRQQTEGKRHVPLCAKSAPPCPRPRRTAADLRQQLRTTRASSFLARRRCARCAAERLFAQRCRPGASGHPSALDNRRLSADGVEGVLFWPTPTPGPPAQMWKRAANEGDSSGATLGACLVSTFPPAGGSARECACSLDASQLASFPTSEASVSVTMAAYRHAPSRRGATKQPTTLAAWPCGRRPSTSTWHLAAHPEFLKRAAAQICREAEAVATHTLAGCQRPRRRRQSKFAKNMRGAAVGLLGMAIPYVAIGSVLDS